MPDEDADQWPESSFDDGDCDEKPWLIPEDESPSAQAAAAGILPPVMNHGAAEAPPTLESLPPPELPLPVIPASPVERRLITTDEPTPESVVDVSPERVDELLGKLPPLLPAVNREKPPAPIPFDEVELEAEPSPESTSAPGSTSVSRKRIPVIALGTAAVAVAAIIFFTAIRNQSSEGKLDVQSSGTTQTTHSAGSGNMSTGAGVAADPANQLPAAATPISAPQPETSSAAATPAPNPVVPTPEPRTPPVPMELPFPRIKPDTTVAETTTDTNDPAKPKSPPKKAPFTITNPTLDPNRLGDKIKNEK